MKIISCCESWYPAGQRVRGTDKRAGGLQAVYMRKARLVDVDVIGVDCSRKGPVERKLEVYGDLLGLCFGAWGEGSDGVHQLVQTLAESRLKFQCLH